MYELAPDEVQANASLPENPQCFKNSVTIYMKCL